MNFRGKERVEDLARLLRWQPYAGIADGHHKLLVFRAPLSPSPAHTSRCLTIVTPSGPEVSLLPVAPLNDPLPSWAQHGVGFGVDHINGLVGVVAENIKSDDRVNEADVE
jgi:hypothetical protein